MSAHVRTVSRTLAEMICELLSFGLLQGRDIAAVAGSAMLLPIVLEGQDHRTGADAQHETLPGRDVRP